VPVFALLGVIIKVLIVLWLRSRRSDVKDSLLLSFYPTFPPKLQLLLLPGIKHDRIGTLQHVRRVVCICTFLTI